jgi:hypothetical protein
MAIITIDENNLTEVGENIMSTISKDSGVLVLVIDITKEIGESSSGKMMGIGSTGGFVPVPGTKAKMNLYIGTKI